MKVSEIKNHLLTAATINFKLVSGAYVPEHFHVTEIGLVSKHFIDCGGTIRFEKVANFQLWNANDFEHRLQPQKLLKILAISEKILGNEDLEIEVEYQTETIGKYGLHYNGKDFILIPKHTACRASESCGIPSAEQKVPLNESPTQTACCAPRSGCC